MNKQQIKFDYKKDLTDEETNLLSDMATTLKDDVALNSYKIWKNNK